MAQVQLALLGGFQARCGESPPLILSARKAHALLTYLALPPGQAHPRSQLAALLWGELPEAEARASLRQALFTLRKALPVGLPPVLLVDRTTVALEPKAVEVDVARFERLVAEGTPAALVEAAGLYRGDLLAGLVLKEAPGFEEWLLGERERLRELAQEGLAKLLAHQRRVGAIDAAVQTGLKLLTLDPLQEPVHRTLMRLYAELGRRGAALRQYQHCLGVMQRELGLEPEAETKGLLRRGLAVPGLEDHVILVQAGRACLAYVQTLSGRANEAIPSREEIVAQVSVMRTAGPPRIITYLGEAYLLGGRAIDAARHAAWALALARDRGERGNEAWALRLAGEIALRESPDDVARAGDHLRQALELTRELGMRPLEAHCRASLGVLTGDRAELAAATDLYRALDMPFWLARLEDLTRRRARMSEMPDGGG
jgi:DNA-binding SARP family transcriptional activator